MMKYIKSTIWFLAICLIPGIASVSGANLKDILYDEYDIELYGYAEGRQGFRVKDDPYQKTQSISEFRLQVDLGRYFDWGSLKFKGDLAQDFVRSQFRAETRELNASLMPLDNLDLKIGRQILTWGTGDLLFINDLFPKDWKSFFIGRDDEYLKAPSDAVKFSFFFDVANLDVIYSPVFNGSVYIDGKRLSYWNPLLGRMAGRDYIMYDEKPDDYFSDSEVSVRAFKSVSGVEVAVYGYYGYWKTPEGINPNTGKLIYPELSAYGASARSTFLGGIANIEVGYYDSRDDRSGDDPFVRNSEVRFLTGFEREIMRNLTGSVQYYVEYMMDHDAYKDSVGGQFLKDEYRHLLTFRLTQLMMNQNLNLSLFTYYSPSDDDAYLRPKVSYKVTDRWTVDGGMNIFWGEEDYTFFGQFDKNTNVYAGLRWNY